MDKFIKKWNGKFIEDDVCYASAEWKSFSRQFKALMKREGGKLSLQLAGKNPFGQCHYFVSGHLEKDGMSYYVSYDYDRGLPVDLTRGRYAGPVLWRRTKDSSDYTGEVNHFCPLNRLFKEIGADIERRAV